MPSTVCRRGSAGPCRPRRRYYAGMDTAVVTGAGGGLGRLISQGLAARGLAVLATDIDGGAAAATADLCGDSSWSQIQDVRDPDSHRAIASEASARGRLALWINNAGVLSTCTAWEQTDEDVARHVDINFSGVIWGSRAAIDVMRDSAGGHIINIASISSIVPAPGLAVYAATKAAVLHFSLALQGDLDNAHIPLKVSAVCPDAIDTNMVRNVADHDESGLLFSSGKLLSPDDVARRVVDLVGQPRLVVFHPPLRAALAHALRPFPALGLKLLSQFRRVGERNRRRRSR